MSKASATTFSATRLLLALALALAIAGPPAAHGAAPVGTAIQLRGCLLTAVMVPRPASTLQAGFRRPLDLSRTFYGPDPLLGIWALDCRRGRVAGRRVGRLIASFVGVPVGLTFTGAPALANNFAHALLRIDTSSRTLAVALRRGGLPAKLSRAARYRHSRPGVVPSRGRLVVPAHYAIQVSASAIDPTNPHDHANRFEHRSGRRVSALSFSADDAVDRFCFPAAGGCSASVSARPGSSLAGLLGGHSAPVRAGFDHERLARINLVLQKH